MGVLACAECRNSVEQKGEHPRAQPTLWHVNVQSEAAALQSEILIGFATGSDQILNLYKKTQRQTMPAV